MHRPLFRAAVAAAFAQAFLAVAADEATVVVTATRMPTRASEVLSDVTTLERADIERAGDIGLPQLLNTLPGVQITTNGGPGASGTLSIRGANSTHALVLVDGRRLSSATMGTTAIEHIPLEQIERIEVLRGPASSLYGADALGGVVQIFTRQGDGLPAPFLSFGAGRYGKVVASAGYGGRSGDTRFHVQAGKERISGFSDIRQAKGGTFDMYNPDPDGYENDSFSGRFAQRVSRDVEVGIDFFHAKSIKHYDASNCDAFYTVCTTAFDNRLRQMLQSTAVFADWRINPLWKTSLRVGSSQDRMTNWLFDPTTNIVSDPRYDTRQDQVTWQNDVVLGGGKLLAAAEWRSVHVDSTQTLVATSQTTRALIFGYQKWFGNHSVQGSARNDDISGIGRHDTGSLAYGYRLADRWIARAAIGTAFHAPTFNDLYWPLDPVNFYQGNPQLKPEQARSREVGVSYEGAGVTASATFYRNEVTNLIDFVAGTAPTFIGSMGNVGSVTLKGATFLYARRTGSWDWKASYDVLNARDDATGRVLQRRAPRTGTLEARRSFDRFDVGAQLSATSARFNNSTNTQILGGYGVLNLDANYRLDNRWSLQGRLGNVFAKDYVVARSTLAPFNDYAVTGRALFVGLRYSPH